MNDKPHPGDAIDFQSSLFQRRPTRTKRLATLPDDAFDQPTSASRLAERFAADRLSPPAHATASPHPSACSPPAVSVAASTELPRDLDNTRIQLDHLKRQLNRLQRTVRLAIEQTLAEWSGKAFGSLLANREITATIHELLEGHGLRVSCPECGHPAILRCSARPGIADGVFVFDHMIDGRRTFHGGGTTLPVLRLVAKPARKRPSDSATTPPQAS